MKKTLFLTIILLMFASSAWALTIDDVGGLDQVIDYHVCANSEAAELEWIAGYIGTNISDITMTAYYVTTGTWVEVDDGNNMYAIDFSSCQPDYFFITMGDGNSGSEYDHFLYENSESLDWGVVCLPSITEIWCVETGGIDTINYVGEINATAPVPEPGTMLLLGAGLLGLAGFRRKMKK